MRPAIDRQLPALVRRLARAAIPESVRPWARKFAERHGWLQTPPFQYPFAEIMSRTRSSYPQYLWGTMCAAALASALGHDRTTVIEFGVAGGNGLVELERIAGYVEHSSSVGIDVFGFDTGEGLPQPQDYRDLPNLWNEGYFPMEPERLKAGLRSASLLLGPVAETVGTFIASRPAAIGFVSFDLDLYSSTMDAFQIFSGEADLLLPRVVCYFDDIIGFSHCDFTGERLAIAEFNKVHSNRKLSRLYGLRWVVGQEKWWTDMMYMFHFFDHPEYNLPDGTNNLRDLPLRER